MAGARLGPLEMSHSEMNIRKNKNKRWVKIGTYWNNMLENHNRFAHGIIVDVPFAIAMSVYCGGQPKSSWLWTLFFWDVTSTLINSCVRPYPSVSKVPFPCRTDRWWCGTCIQDQRSSAMHAGCWALPATSPGGLEHGHASQKHTASGVLGVQTSLGSASNFEKNLPIWGVW